MIDKKKIRELLRKTENKFISDRKVSRLLNVNKKAALEILIHLEKLGFIEKSGIDELWQNSLRGKILALKILKKEFKVDTLKRQLDNFIRRLEIVNSSEEYPDCVACAIITSEYPIEQKSEGINIAYSLDLKGLSEKEYMVAADKLRGRYKGSFNNIVQYYFYPNEAIRAFLKSRSPVLKLREYSKEEIKDIVGHKIFG